VPLVGRHRSLLITGITNARTEAANTGITNVKRTARGFRNERRPYHSHECCSKRSMNTHHRQSTFTRNREEPGIHAVQRRPQPRDAVDPTATTSWRITAGHPPALVRHSPKPGVTVLFVARPAQGGPCR